MWGSYHVPPIVYPVSTPQVVENSGEVKFYNALEEYQKTEEGEKKARRKIVIYSLVIGAIVLIGIRMFKKQTTNE